MDWIQQLRLGRVYAYPRAIDMRDVSKYTDYPNRPCTFCGFLYSLLYLAPVVCLCA